MKLLTNLVFNPKGPHNPAQAYNVKDTVMSADGSRVYFALQDVPPGAALTDPAYWIRMIDLSGASGSPIPVLSVNGQVGDISLTAGDIGAADGEALNEKLDKSPGAEFAGKLLYANADGAITPLNLGTGLRIINGALCITGAAASSAAICGQAVCANDTICGGT